MTKCCDYNSHLLPSSLLFLVRHIWESLSEEVCETIKLHNLLGRHLRMITLQFTKTVFVIAMMARVTISTHTRMSNADMYAVANFTDSNSEGFNHLTMHNVTGDVYIGGVNQLYRLNENLELIVNITTGPEYDDEDKEHDTFNKILAFNYVGNDLVTCGGYRGVCQIRHVEDLSVTNSGDVPVYVAANTSDESTIAYVAPHYDRGQQLLYVGTTSTSSNPGEPFVSGRQLEGDRVFEVIDDSGGTTRVDVSVTYTTTFPVKYVAGFSYNSYSYFVTTQKSSNISSDYISKLVRVCQRTDQYYFNSYSEVTLRCSHNSYNLAQAAYIIRPAQDLSQSLALDDNEKALFISFAVGVNNLPTPNAVSAICIFKMSVIEAAFEDAAKGCMEGDGLLEYTAAWMQGANCAGKWPYSRGIHQCYALNYYRYANGVDDQHGYDVEDYTDTLVTSIAVTTVQQHTVGFLGTDTGTILKVHFVNNTRANTYEEIEFQNGVTEVLQDMKFDLDGEHFYKSTDATVHKVKVSECSQFPSCVDCMESIDPYCGWCTLEKRCSNKANCARSNGTSRWLHIFDENMCVKIDSVEPEDGVPVDVTEQITIKMIELPTEDSTNTYLCNYDGLYITSADKIGHNLTCDTLPLENRPKIPAGEDHTTIQLYVRSSETEEDFVHTDFHFYDCSVHLSCSSCVSSKWSCNWCVYENRCTHYLDTCQWDDSMSIVVGDNNLFNISSITGQSFCPQLKMQFEEVLIPVSLLTEIQVDTVNLYENKHLEGYECVLMAEDEPQIIAATRNNETSLTCNPRKYTYKSLVQEMQVRLILRWNAHYVVDDLYGYTVTLYDCSINRRDCSECLSNITTRLPLNCGWCSQTRKCEVEELCDFNWWGFYTLNDCDNPIITQVWPLTGPIEGNTDIIIQGTDLGKQASDIVNVTVANLPCEHLSDRYTVSKKLECKTSASAADITGNVVVTVIGNSGNQREAYINNQFTYRNPSVLNFSPSLGPKSGGTIVALHGYYINAGRIIEAYFSGSSCLIDRMDDTFNESFVFCNTTSTNVKDAAEMSMYFDGSERQAPEDKKFEFTEDPTVTDINPSASMISGGRKINVTGTYFTSIRQPRMLITSGRPFSSEKPCEVSSFSEMVCITPPVDISTSFWNNQNKGDNEVTVGFIMDAVEEVRQLDLDFEIVVDPEYYPFTEEGNIREHRGGQMVVQGKNLNLASTESEVTVTIGQEECRVVSLSDVQLNCILPDDEPMGVNKSGSPTENGLPIVMVEVGNLEFFIGFLKYHVTSQTTPWGIIGGLIAVFVVFIIVVIVIVCYRRRKRQGQAENGLQMKES